MSYTRTSETNKVYERKIPMERKMNGFTGIYIPIEMLEYNGGTLSLIELHILAEIEYFCRIGRYKVCIVKNQHFMDMIGISERSVTRALSHLELLGAISITNKDGRRILQYNFEEFKPKYSGIEYDDYLSLGVTNSSEGVTNSSEGVTNSQNSTFKEENKEENKEEGTQDKPASSKNHSRLYNQEIKTLTNDLDSEDEIQKQTKQRKKLSQFEKLINGCNKEIDNRPYSDEEKDCLRKYLNWAIIGTDSRRITDVKLWKRKLDALDQIARQSSHTKLEIIQQSIDKQWYMFVDIKEINSRKPNGPVIDNFEVDVRTREEREADFQSRTKEYV